MNPTPDPIYVVAAKGTDGFDGFYSFSSLYELQNGLHRIKKDFDVEVHATVYISEWREMTKNEYA